MPMLFVACHRCENLFASGVAPLDALEGKLELIGILERCPSCGDLSRYDTHEFRFPAASNKGDSDRGSPGGSDGDASHSESRGAIELGPSVAPRTHPVNLPPTL